MLNDAVPSPDAVPPTAISLAALAAHADGGPPGTPLAMHALPPSPALPLRRPPGADLQGNGVGAPLQGVPMSRDVSQISVSGFYALLE